ncbi:MAG: hypothetical protein LAN71_02050 [Acidobacteriia bacterium]|nr:hypothetical protein [Terriglobia bacterium]
MDNAKKGAAAAAASAANADQLDLKRQRDVLELSRKKVMADMEATTNPRYKATLEAALKHLDKQLAALR